MVVIAALGFILLFVGVVMGLTAGFIYYLPYSIYFTIFVALVVGIGVYAINRSDKHHS